MNIFYLSFEAVKESEKEPNDQIKDVGLLEVDGEERDSELHRGRETLVDQDLGLGPLVSYTSGQVFEKDQLTLDHDFGYKYNERHFFKKINEQVSISQSLSSPAPGLFPAF